MGLCTHGRGGFEVESEHRTYLSSALFSGLARIAIALLIPASARKYAVLRSLLTPAERELVLVMYIVVVLTISVTTTMYITSTITSAIPRSSARRMRRRLSMAARVSRCPTERRRRIC